MSRQGSPIESDRPVMTVMKRNEIEPDLWQDVVELCDRAFDQDMAAIFSNFPTRYTCKRSCMES